MFRRSKLKKTKDLLKIEEDVWHVILGGVRDGSKAIDEGLRLSIENWERAGFLSVEFRNSVLKENMEWKVVEKTTMKYRVFSRASDLANLRTLPVGTDGRLVEYLQDVDWLEKLMEQEQIVDTDGILNSGMMKKKEEEKKMETRKAKKRVLEKEDEEEARKTQKKKKMKRASSGTESSRKSRGRKREHSPESKSFLFELEQLELEDHVEVDSSVSHLCSQN